MTIKEKIKLYCDEENISLTEFASSVDETRQNLNAMISGQSRLNGDILKKMRKVHPGIDLNRLLDDEENDYVFVAEDREHYGNDEFKKRLAEDCKKVIQLMERYI